ncbi:histidine phosphatase family protein [Streptomyces sp. ISL-100]|uniref:histidine phosphatase family protein n=1 Tax=Streptomyces sp. ISL-100 TaxID=2819173 RepID=UPI001BE9D138|nr:histidine phosphatase family protein [Streptomyces sp. ISL-100]MBT2396182.1 histidine phosphatase family protein [Streptomyces sp. ISL-100]
MTVRVTLVSPAMSKALSDVRFDDDSSLAPAGLARAEAAAGALPPALHVYTSPSQRCRQTAQALGLNAEPLAGLAACDMGRWRGQTLDAVAAAEAEAVALWLDDPTAAPHGGEALRDVRIRVGAWLDTVQHSLTGRIVAVAEPDVVRAAVLHALSAPDQAVWRLDVRPLTATELSGRAQRWNLLNGYALRPRNGEVSSHR